MYHNLLNFLWTWLWEDSKIYLFLESLLSWLWENSFNLILIAISLGAISYIAYHLLWWKYIKSKKMRGGPGRRIEKYYEYIEKEIYKIGFYLIISITLIVLFFVKWLWIDLLDSIISWSSYDWENYPWVAILFWYKTDSVLYQYYNIGRYLLLLVIFFFTVYNGIMYYTVWERINRNGEVIKYYPIFKNSFIALFIIIIMLFSTIIDGSLSWIVSFFSDTGLHDMINWWSTKL